MIDEGLFTRQLVDAYLFFFFTTRIFCSPVIHRGLSGGELVLKDRSGSAPFQKYVSSVHAFFNAPFYAFFNAPFNDASCKTRVLEVDDETYVTDGMPLPTTSVC